MAEIQIDLEKSKEAFKIRREGQFIIHVHNHAFGASSIWLAPGDRLRFYVPGKGEIRKNYKDIEKIEIIL